MAKFTNLTSDVRFITHGVEGLVRAVKPGEIATVSDAVAEAYACQPKIWGPACAVAKAAVASVAAAVKAAVVAEVAEVEKVVDAVKGVDVVDPASAPVVEKTPAVVPADETGVTTK